MSEIVKLEMSQYGLQESKAKDIEKLYLPMIEMLTECEEQFNEIVSLEINTSTITMAKRLRLDIAKIRTTADKARISAKEEYLRANKAIQGAYNTLEYAVKSKEEKLQAIENHFEKLEAERIEKLKSERIIELSKYEVSEYEMPSGLGNMEEPVWKNYIQGVALSFKARKQAEKQAELERIAKEKAEAESREKQRLENERLKAEAEKREKQIEHERKKQKELQYKKDLQDKKRNEELKSYIIFIRDYSKLLNSPEKEYQKELAEIKISAKQHYEHEAKLEAERIEKAEKEKIEKEKLEAELKAKLEAEKIEKEKLEAEKLKEKLEAEKLAKAPIKKQLLNWIDTIYIEEAPVNNEKSKLIKEKFESFKKWAKTEIESI